ncbi:MAG: hypothetical protein KDH92_15450 [Chloroflexi bacterium]|nr:hypothetical protein [Chloroflexota bacterium]
MNPPAAGLPPRTAEPRAAARFALLGVGGAGLGALRRLRESGLEGLRFVVADTSRQSLAQAGDAHRVLLDGGSRGLGSGGDPLLGRAAAVAGAEAVLAACGQPDLVLLAAGLAGGTGGGGAPELARRLRASGVRVLGFGIMPFRFESHRRAAAAERALAELRAACDTTLTLDNDRVLAVTGAALPLDISLRVADEVLRQAAVGLYGLTRRQGWLNVDLSLLYGLLEGGGDACLALGIGRGEAPAQGAMHAAMASPLSNMAALAHARAVLAQIVGGDLELGDTEDAIALLRQRLPSDCRIVTGAAPDPNLKGAAQVLLLGVGLAGPARMPLSWRRQPEGLEGMPGRLRLDLQQGAYVMDAPPLRRVV